LGFAVETLVVSGCWWVPVPEWLLPKLDVVGLTGLGRALLPMLGLPLSDLAVGV